jgi:hypothetical protein
MKETTKAPATGKERDPGLQALLDAVSLPVLGAQLLGLHGRLRAEKTRQALIALRNFSRCSSKGSSIFTFPMGEPSEDTVMPASLKVLAITSISSSVFFTMFPSAFLGSMKRKPFLLSASI